MCGICGICLDDTQSRVDAALLGEMNDALRHRGPDDEGTHLAGHVGLGHRRLSIIDLDSGHQPIFNEDKSISIVFNGEIYNYVELAESLVAKGHRLATHSDTETIVHLYEEHGVDCVTKLNGMFAFALWDAPKKQLLLARDRIGKKPLYYTYRDGRLLFASELKSLLKAKDQRFELDLQSLDDYLAYGYVPAPRTIFRDVHKLPAGCTMVWQPGRIVIKPYWDLSFPENPHGDEAEHIEKLESIISEAVKIRLRSDVPLGAFLSGGLDSSLVVAFASEVLNRPLKTFSIGFHEQDFDELSYARLVAERFGTEHTEIIVEDDQMSIFSEMVRQFDEPFADSSAIPTYFVSREARRHVTVCLSGDGGDELFAGYDRYADAMRYARTDWLPASVRRHVLGGVARTMPRGLRGRGFLRRASFSGVDRYQCQVGIFAVDERMSLVQPELCHMIDRDVSVFARHFGNGHQDLLTRHQRVDQKTYLPDDILVKVDRMSMWHSLEVRAPLLDYNVIEYANTIQPSLKLHRGNGKHILKRMMASRLPPKIVGRAKMGFGLPLEHWLCGRLRPFVMEMLLSPDSRCQQYLRKEAVGDLLEQHVRHPQELTHQVWALLVLEEWLRSLES